MSKDAFILKVMREPEKHYVFLGAIISLCAGLCAWQYSKGYFHSLGIAINYAPFENLLFMFEQIVFVEVSDGWLSKISFCGVVIPALCGAAISFVIRIIAANPERERSGSCNEDYSVVNNKSRRHVAVFFMLLLIWIVIVFLIAFANQISGIHSAITVAIGMVCIVIGMVSSIIDFRYINITFFVILGVVLSFIVPNYFYEFGVYDAQRIVNEEYRSLNDICLSRPFDPVKPAESSRRLACGKLIYINSENVCIKMEDFVMVTCIERKGYEVNIIRNI